MNIHTPLSQPYNCEEISQSNISNALLLLGLVRFSWRPQGTTKITLHSSI